ncbi:endonuclease-reverse transcriptase [Elysia marginata]|uniref:Endonuclease-reverse transcriptase n=1 Tax=Elysia marginata TaxID=1093978 RepID=A0AAV4HE25_9GAST|nr:endonuclease-reverse transcriptase [Elysia marginata]
MKTNAKSNSDVLIDGKSVENVTDCKHLGSYLNADGNINREITARIVMASTAFYKLNNIWKSNRMMKDTKLKLYTSNVRSVLLNASETWKTNQRIESKLRGFEGRCPRRVLGIRWEHRVTNKEISERTGIRQIVEEVNRKRWRWLGHVLRMSKPRHPLFALTWNPQGARKKGRPQSTWRRSVENERVESGKTYNELN